MTKTAPMESSDDRGCGQVCGPLREQARQAVADIVRAESIVAEAARELLDSFGEARRRLVVDAGPAHAPHFPGAIPPMDRAIAALQFEDIAIQLLRRARARLEAAAGHADGDVGAAAIVLPAVEQDSMACGTVELF